MRTRRWGRSLASLVAVLGMGVAAPLALGAAPAHAQPIPEVTKSHVGDFTQNDPGQ